MKNNFEKVLSELTEGKKDYEIHHKAYYKAVDEILAFIKKNGYEVSDDEVFNQISTGGKPGREKTKRIRLELTKNDKVQRKAMNAQVYQLPHGTFELNMYIQ